MKLSPEKVQSYFENKKKESISTENPVVASNTDSAYNLEEFAVTEEEEEPTAEAVAEKIPEFKPSQFEINKEALKPTISHASEINLNPISKPLTVEKNRSCCK